MRRRFVSAEELAYYRAHIREAIREDGVVCLECGKLYEFLPNHLPKHGLTKADYQEKWGYNRTTALITPAHHEKLRQQALAQNFAALGPPGAIRKAMGARLRLKLSGRLETRLVRQEGIRARFASGWRPSDKLKKVDDATLRGLAGQGLNFRQIALRTGVSYMSVRARIRAMGLTSPACFQPKATDADLLALRQAGLSFRKIAARVGMTVSGVQSRLRVLRRRGLAEPGSLPPR